ncbi:MAG: ABC transporter substrate-binding protein [Firmicutes bacterium]|nr:ABC transporter substrate-binding protein [Bacillota bacterium]
MKTAFKLSLAAALAITLAVGMVGCNKTNKTQTGGVTLRWVTLGPGEQADSDMVWKEFNQKLQEKMPGVDVDLQVFSKTDFEKKWKLMSASKEVIDIAWSGWLVDYKSEARKGAYMELDELIDKEAPKLKEELNAIYHEMNGSGSVFDSTKVDGKIYIVPILQALVSEGQGLITHKDLSDRYWDLERAQTIFAKAETADNSCYDIIEEYLKNLKDNDQIKTGIDTVTFPWFYQKGYKVMPPGFVIKNVGEKDYKVYNTFETAEYKLYIEKMADWYKKGYIRSDVISVENPRQNNGRIDGNILWVSPTYNEFMSESETKANGFPTAVLNIWDKKDGTSSYSAYSGTSVSIPKTSKNAEKALRLIELINTKEGKELYNMLSFGLEGVHYERVNENRIETFDDSVASALATTNSKYGMWNWVVGNTFNTYETQTNPEGWYDYVRNAYKDANKDSDLIRGFEPDLDTVKTEIAQINTVIGEFQNSLLSGAVAAYEESYNRFIEKLNKAGMEKVLVEVQRQFDGYLDENK